MPFLKTTDKSLPTSCRGHDYLSSALCVGLQKLSHALFNKCRFSPLLTLFMSSSPHFLLFFAQDSMNATFFNYLLYILFSALPLSFLPNYQSTSLFFLLFHSFSDVSFIYILFHISILSPLYWTSLIFFIFLLLPLSVPYTFYIPH